MYPFERYLNRLKQMVKNRSHVEGYLDDRELDAAHLHTLLNCEEVQPFIEFFVQYLQESHPNICQTAVNDRIASEFPSWFRAYVHDENNKVQDLVLHQLAYGPKRKVHTWPIYFVNGFKFHTEEWSVGGWWGNVFYYWIFFFEMANKATEKVSKNHKLKHLKRSSQQISSHDATPHTMPSTTRISNGTHTNTAPHIRESTARTSNEPPPHVATATRTSNIPPPEVASTVRTSNVPHHHVPHASCATRTSNSSSWMNMEVNES
ncbi:hypothetical protein P8452_32622 [Trifolium repens]|nr:hypothetical protein P8452_32622 [Trifolium repens]